MRISVCTDNEIFKMPSIGGAELRITTDSKQGGRKYMEDVVHIHFEESEDKSSFEYAYFAIFDGHGGPSAGQFAKEHLLGEITKQKNFWSNDDTQVLKAIKDGFISCHRLMWKAVGKFWFHSLKQCCNYFGACHDLQNIS